MVIWIWSRIHESQTNRFAFFRYIKPFSNGQYTMTMSSRIKFSLLLLLRQRWFSDMFTCPTIITVLLSTTSFPLLCLGMLHFWMLEGFFWHIWYPFIEYQGHNECIRWQHTGKSMVLIRACELKQMLRPISKVDMLHDQAVPNGSYWEDYVISRQIFGGRQLMCGPLGTLLAIFLAYSSIAYADALTVLFFPVWR